MAPALFRQRSLSAGLLTQLVFWSGQASFFLVLALYLQQGRGMTALQAGLLFTVLAVAYVVASARAPGLVARHGRQVIAAGALALAAGHAMLLATVADVGVSGSVVQLVPALVLIGTAMGLLIVSLTTTILSGVHPDDAGAAASDTQVHSGQWCWRPSTSGSSTAATAAVISTVPAPSCRALC